MIKIGLTGPTGAGKSTVASVFTQAGAYHIDADAVARTAVNTPATLRALADTFGVAILRADGTLDRKALANVAFSSKQNTAKLNAITHPVILAEIRRQLDAATGTMAVLDVPLLFESGLDALCDITVAVLAPKEIRRTRIMARDGITAHAATARMAAQPDDHFYIARATHILHNDTTAANLIQAAKTLLTDIGGEYDA